MLSIQNRGHSCLNMQSGKIYNIHTLYIAEHIFLTRINENSSIVPSIHQTTIILW